MIIYLVGISCVGKTTVGKMLAEKMGYPFFDLDEDIHSILTKELAVERNLRKRRVGISGTNYKPLDNVLGWNKNELQTTCIKNKTCYKKV